MKIIILDEADYMTNIAQCALRQIIEKYSKNVRFCIICNYINKIIPAIQSRCMKFRFSLLTHDEMKTKINYIVEQEKIKISDQAITTIISLSGGDMRKSINILQTIPIFCKNKIIDDNDIRMCLGYPTEKIITSIYDILTNKNEKIRTKYNLINDIIKNDGILLCNLLQCLHKIVLKNKKKFVPKKLIYILKTFAEIEQSLTQNVNENIQLGILISSFC